MSTAEVTAVILEKMDSVLQSAGYRRRGHTFYASREDVALMVNLQKSRLGDGKVTVNLGVHSPTLAAKLTPSSSLAESLRTARWPEPLIKLQLDRSARQRRAKPSRTPPPEEAHWWQRIGALGPDGSNGADIWWEARDAAEAKAAGDQIAELLRTNALPALDAVSSTDKLKAYWQGGGSGGLSEKLRRTYLAALGE